MADRDVFQGNEIQWIRYGEDHLKDIQRVEKLALLGMIAFVWCYKVGIHLHKIKPIQIEKHGRMAKSIFKYGLPSIAITSLITKNQHNTNISQFLSCT
ncbi:hypothetical protein [Aquimarina sp. RZ0]|uniref:hypothetical protein n=1 Tax=Aquimarina sp. RZ0 TaxID=2607730 RepID=UPI0011F3F043|nr:hypothetical protein [Aquimarina sp. RZ0]KAA1246000.1 hypothetical protein F0000_09810 [Aquimarina sp. RZ0]